MNDRDSGLGTRDSKFAWAALLLPFAVAACAQSPPQPAGAADPVRALHQLFDDEWERQLRENPLQASYLGDRRYKDRWPDESLSAIERYHDEDLAALARLAKIPRNALPPAEQLNADLFRRRYEDETEGFRYHPFVMPVDHIYGIQSSQQILQVLSFETRKDYEDWIARLNGFGVYMDQTIALMREGVKEGRVPPHVLMQKIPEQIARQLVQKPEESPFYAPFKHFPKDLPPDAQAQLAQSGAKAIAETVVPAFQRFRKFFTEAYLPASRESIGASALPDGAAYYAHLVRHHTTTDLAPDQIHEIGLNEVKRIRGEMEAIIKQVGFKGGFAAFSKFLRSDPRFYFKTGDALLTAYAALAKRIDGELPRLFDRLPRLPYGVRPVPAETAPYQTTAYYQPGAADGSRAGFFYANLYKPETRPKWEMEALTAHEAVPGHHLQIALQQELEDLPKFRKFDAHYTAFVEGWGLYAESLGGELGLYKDPYSRYGQLTYEMWRAVRLVVDTGIHAKGWPRSQAIDFFKANTPRAEHDIAVEVDRYIAWPGQALAYKIGQLKITGLRECAQRELGDQFDLRTFHDVVLGSGALPLDVLERNVNDWVSQRASAMP